MRPRVVADRRLEVMAANRNGEPRGYEEIHENETISGNSIHASIPIGPCRSRSLVGMETSVERRDGVRPNPTR